MSTIEIKVPDIGDFKDVAIIEVLVKPGDTVRQEQSLVTVESDKASMEIPTSHAGVVKEMRVKLGDKVSEGSVLLTLETSEAAATPAAPAAASSPAPAAPTPPKASATPATASAAMPPASSLPADIECDVLVLGAGPGGYSAAFRAADLGLSVVLVERYATLGGVCLNVGCIPSKALLHVAAVIDEARHLEAAGVRFGAFADAYTLHVQETGGSGQQPTGGTKAVRFKRCIIAAGSQAVHLPFMPDDPRVVDSTGALALKSVPKRMLIVGGGIIGLEMGTVYSTLGARLDVVEMQDGLMQGADRDLVKVWQKLNQPRFDRILLQTKTVGAEATPEGIKVRFEGLDGARSEGVYDLVLQAVGRTPNGKKIAADKVGVAVTERGFIEVDAQMRTNAPHIFAIGDIVGQPMLAHKAVHEAHVAAEVIAGELKGDEALARSAFTARVIPSVAYTDPEVAWVGLTEEQAKAQGVKVKKGLFPWTASGRAIANGRDEGFTKLLFDEASHRIVGGGIVGTHAGDMIGEIALAIEMGADAIDIGQTIHPHPTLGESLGMAAEVVHGSCTDLPPQRK